MNQLIALSKTETLFQARSGFLVVGAIVTVLWLSVLVFVPEGQQPLILGLVLSLDVASVAMLFCMGLHLIENRQQVLLALGVTPLNPDVKVWSRVLLISVTTLLISSLIIIVHVPAERVLPLLAICAMNAVFFSVAGYLLVIHTPNVSQLIVRLGAVSPIWLIPYLAYFGFFNHPLLAVMPTYGLIMMFADNPEYGGVTLINFANFLCWFVVLSVWLHRAYPKVLSRS
ncbi:hypothetical protein CS022_06630 [Veronia nyctiphanis]|uniref:Uncharacterized protein n=1 Tax=Veronia nyctiphanis TaxID=1278244 RepID=A0A4Q0YY07_9GAMM|nr:hypothetical protein [Veronia nyctiphanis]RXJ73951.1 hypothetical protein CS022_06630 [Veronia nyctiphanis]